MVKTVRNRSAVPVAPDRLLPTGQCATISEAMAAFDQQRAATIDYLKPVQGDLRTHYSPNQVFSLVDAYQAISLMASHAEQHRRQIEGAKTSPSLSALNGT